ncbi:MAG: phosphate-starvation-inducible PsiE family protein [Wenzhouxiangellaceae bacterium]|nr:phosphate-starvation-inducible PsiE family protein [Wenzhouxiangellaceae bacterium]
MGEKNQQADPVADDPINPELSPVEETYAIGGFRLAERLLLIVTGLMALMAAGFEVWNVIDARTVALADILLMFLYTEVIAMVAVFYTGRGSPFIYPIFIAITALSRLIVLQGKDMAPQNILYEAGAILLLAMAAILLTRTSLK